MKWIEGVALTRRLPSIPIWVVRYVSRGTILGTHVSPKGNPNRGNVPSSNEAQWSIGENRWAHSSNQSFLRWELTQLPQIQILLPFLYYMISFLLPTSTLLNSMNSTSALSSNRDETGDETESDQWGTDFNSAAGLLSSKRYSGLSSSCIAAGLLRDRMKLRSQRVKRTIRNDRPKNDTRKLEW